MRHVQHAAPHVSVSRHHCSKAAGPYAKKRYVRYGPRGPGRAPWTRTLPRGAVLSTPGGTRQWLVGPHHAKARSEEHTSELQSLMRISYAVFCLKKKKKNNKT